MGQKIYSVDDKASGLVNALAVNDENDVVFVTLNGQTIRVHVKDISIQGRSARGVKVASFKQKDDSIVAMAATDYQEESDEEIEIPEQAPAENEATAENKATAEPVSDDQNQ